jgi:hypothetical protein
MPEQRCRICGFLRVRATDDLHICIECAALSVFTETGSRTPTDDERAEAVQQPGVVAAIRCIREHSRG